MSIVKEIGTRIAMALVLIFLGLLFLFAPKFAMNVLKKASETFNDEIV